MGEQSGIANDNAEAVTVQDGSPYTCFPKQSPVQKIGMFAFPCLIGVIYLAIVVFMIVMFYRLVRATEKIASKLENGITIKKEDPDQIV